MKIVISGATGHVGSELAKVLSQRGATFRAMVRSRERAEALAGLPGLELVLGDFDDEESLGRALRGAERAFLLTNSSERAEAQQAAFVDAARREGIRHIVKLSQWGAERNSPARFLRYHAAIEARIQESGMAYTFLRPNWFMQDLVGFRTTVVATSQFFAAAEDAKISVVDVRDVAEGAAAALLEKGHEGKVYALTGPAALTHADMASQLASALGRPIEYVNVSPDAMRAALLDAGLPEWQTDGLIEDYAHYRRGEAAAVAPGVKGATGKPPRSFAEFARDYAPSFA